MVRSLAAVLGLTAQPAPFALVEQQGLLDAGQVTEELADAHVHPGVLGPQCDTNREPLSLVNVLVNGLF